MRNGFLNYNWFLLLSHNWLLLLRRCWCKLRDLRCNFLCFYRRNLFNLQNCFSLNDRRCRYFFLFSILHLMLRWTTLLHLPIFILALTLRSPNKFLITSSRKPGRSLFLPLLLRTIPFKMHIISSRSRQRTIWRLISRQPRQPLTSYILIHNIRFGTFGLSHKFFYCKSSLLSENICC